MIYYLDTNTCIYFLNGSYSSVREKILNTSPELIVIPSIVKAELVFGAYKSKKREVTLNKVEEFLSPFEILPFSDPMTYVYADIRSSLERNGSSIGPNDMFIAATVLTKNGTLVTHNTREFSRVDGLKIEDWVIES